MNPPEADYYADLELYQAASQAEIKKAYRRLALAHHPDKKAPGQQNVDAADFRKIQTAYETLSDDTKRRLYDSRYARIQRSWDRYRAWEFVQERRRATEEARKQAAAEAAAEKAKNEELARKAKEIWSNAEHEWAKVKTTGTKPDPPPQDSFPSGHDTFEEYCRRAKEKEDAKAKRVKANAEARRQRWEERIRLREEERERQSREAQASGSTRRS